jgi:hypothetical protein
MRIYMSMKMRKIKSTRVSPEEKEREETSVSQVEREKKRGNGREKISKCMNGWVRGKEKS